MLIRLSKNAFVRQYGLFTYVFDRQTAFDEMYHEAEIFFRWITREARDIEEVIRNVCVAYGMPESTEIAVDFNEFLQPLIAQGIILAGESEAELSAQEKSFSYDDDDPKTLEVNRLLSSNETEILPQNVLGTYFQEHPTPFHLQLDITQACTERCVHCYIPEYNPVFLPFGKIREILDEFREMGGLEIALSGGECMLHPDFEKIVQYAREKDLLVGVLSNLTLCNDRIVQLLRETDSTVQVSLYSMEPSIHDAITKRSGSWVETKNAIEKLRAAHVPCRISCPTMKANYKGYLDVLEWARSLRMSAQTDFIIMGKMNCDTSNLAYRLDLNQTREILEDIVFRSVPMNSEYFDPAKKSVMLTDEEWMANKVCGAAIDSLCVDATGEYYPCAAFGGFHLGNCYEHSLSWVWNESPETRRIRSVRGRDFPKCASCKDRDYCSVCMCRNFNETGNIFTPAEHFCNVAAINHTVVDELLAKRKEANL